MIESGIAGFEFRLVRTRGTGRHAEAHDRQAQRRDQPRAEVRPEVIEQFRVQGYEPIGGTPEEMNTRIKADVVRWTKIIRDAGIKPQ